MSDEATIKISQNGPYAVKGVTTMTDPEGNPIETKATMFLCRCGLSQNKPFCDGSHSKNDWVAG